MDNLKSGLRTSEFWLSLALSLGSSLALFGVIGPDQQAALQAGVSHIVNGVKEIVLGATTVAPVVMYVWSRTQLKLAALSGKTTPPAAGS